MDKDCTLLNKTENITSHLLALKSLFPYQRGTCEIFEDMTEEGRKENDKYLNDKQQYLNLINALGTGNHYRFFIQARKQKRSVDYSSERVDDITINLGLIGVASGPYGPINYVQIDCSPRNAYIIGEVGSFTPLFLDVAWNKSNEGVKVATIFAPRNYPLEMLIENEFFDYIEKNLKKGLEGREAIYFKRDLGVLHKNDKNEQIINNGLDFVNSLLSLLPVVYGK